MPEKPPQTRFLVSLFATPRPLHQEIFYTVPRAGHLVGGPDHHVQRDHFPGHELIYCVKGRGFARIAGHRHAVFPGDFLWINCHHPHEHGAVESDPWEVFWIRMEGPKLADMCDILSVSTRPVVGRFPRTSIAPLFQHIFRLLPDESTHAAAQVHALVAHLISLVFSHRQPAAVDTEQVPPALHKAIERMRLFYFERFTVDRLARLCGMSASHFAHAFKRAFGTSPIDWLRRERINQAKRRLAGTKDRIEEIAQQVGYADRFYFSKDFKKLTGHSPRQFRALEAS